MFTIRELSELKRDINKAQQVIKKLSSEDAQGLFRLVMQESGYSSDENSDDAKLLKILIEEKPELNLNQKIQIRHYNDPPTTITPLQEALKRNHIRIATALLNAPQIDLSDKNLFNSPPLKKETALAFREACIQKFNEELQDNAADHEILSRLVAKYETAALKPDEVYAAFLSQFTHMVSNEKTPELKLQRINVLKLKLEKSALSLYLKNHKLFAKIMEEINKKEQLLKDFQTSFQKAIPSQDPSSSSRAIVLFRSNTAAVVAPSSYFKYDPTQLSTANTLQGDTGGLLGNIGAELYLEWLNYSPPSTLATAIGFPKSEDKLPVKERVLRALYAEIYIFDFLKAGASLEQYVKEKKHEPILAEKEGDRLISFLVDFEMYHQEHLVISSSRAIIEATPPSQPLIKMDQLVNFLKNLLGALSQDHSKWTDAARRELFEGEFPLLMTYLLVKPTTSFSYLLSRFSAQKQDKMATLQKVLKEVLIEAYVLGPTAALFGNQIMENPLKSWNSSSSAKPFLNKVLAITSDGADPTDRTIENLLEAYAIYLRIEKAMKAYDPNDVDQIRPDNECLKIWKNVLAQGPKLIQIIESITYQMNKKEKEVDESKTAKDKDLYDELDNLLPNNCPYTIKQIREASLSEFAPMKRNILFQVHPDRMAAQTLDHHGNPYDTAKISALLRDIAELKAEMGNKLKQ